MKAIIILLAFAAVASSIPFTRNRNTPVVITVDDVDDKTKYLLDGIARPSHYKVELTLLDDFAQTEQFFGKVAITFQASDKIKELKVHKYKGISVNHWKLGDNFPIVNKYTFDEELEILTILLENEIDSGRDYVVEIDYNGTLTRDMNGFYLSTYQENGQTRTLATTQFEPTYARRAFPCFDEPSYKATFDISINHPESYKAVFENQPEITGTTSTKAIFDTTPKMSTYLIAFIVSQFEKFDITGNANMAIYARPDASKYIEFSKEVTPKILNSLSKYTNIDYFATGIKHLMQASIPDFEAGAMENWGLVTYRESMFLYDKDQSTTRTQWIVADTIAHEFAHMWFGDLVTMKWWNYIWLNEGFATYFAMHATNDPTVGLNYNSEMLYVLENVQSVMVDDGFPTSTSLNSPAYSPTDIWAKFDGITYSKGGSVIRMMVHFIGADNFQKGIRDYLGNEKNTVNVEPSDLFASLNKFYEDGDIEAIMASWVDKPGYPVIEVSQTDSKTFTFKQKRFLYSGTDTTTWNVPISCTLKSSKDFSNTKPTIWLKTAQDTLTLPNEVSEDDWIVLNMQQTGYFRINYEEALWRKIYKTLNSDNIEDIHYMNRAQMLDDLMNLARADHITYDFALEMSNYLSKETNYFPWYSALTGFTFLMKRFNSGSMTSSFSSHVSGLMKTVYKEVGFDKDPTDHVGKLRNELLLRWACKVDYDNCNDKAVDIFNGYVANNEKVKPDFKNTVYCAGAKKSTSNWDSLYGKLERETWAQEISLILTALGCTKDKDTLLKYLERSVETSSSKVIKDGYAAFRSVASGTPEGVDVALDFFIDKSDAMNTAYGSLSGPVLTLADRLTTDEQFEKFTNFLGTSPAGISAALARTAIETANANQKFIKDHQPSLNTFFKGGAGIFKANGFLLTALIAVTFVKYFV